MYCLETHDLGHRYANQSVLEHVSLQVPRGSIYGFLGPNGAGKTTTLRLVLGLLRKQRGAITLFGMPLDANRIDILGRVGSLIESPSSYDHLTAWENLRILQKVHRCPDARIREVLQLTGLAHTERKRVREFSLGMKQRLGIAAALLSSPALLILDEPTNGLDPNGIIEMRSLLITLNREHGVTILVSSHLLAEIEKLATDVGIIHRGRIAFQGTLDALRRKQEQAISVRIGTSDAPRALELVAPFVAAARLVNGQLVLPDTPEPLRARVNRVLVESGIDVHEIQSVRLDLEAIFMGMVGGLEA